MSLGLYGKKDPREWDEYVPIIRVGRNIDIYLSEAIEAPAMYNEMCHTIRNADRYDTINIYVNNGGGYVDSGLMLTDVLKDTRANTIAHLSGTVASIATVITLSCKNLVVADFTSFMIHNYSGGVRGKGGEMKLQMDFMARELAITFRAVYAGFLTPDEIEDVIDDRDLWLNKTEVEARWKARKDKDLDELEIISQARKEALK